MEKIKDPVIQRKKSMKINQHVRPISSADHTCNQSQSSCTQRHGRVLQHTSMHVASTRQQTNAMNVTEGLVISWGRMKIFLFFSWHSSFLLCCMLFPLKNRLGSITVYDKIKATGMTRQEAQHLAVDSVDWRRCMVQCVFDMGWTKVHNKVCKIRSGLHNKCSNCTNESLMAQQFSLLTTLKHRTAMQLIDATITISIKILTDL